MRILVCNSSSRDQRPTLFGQKISKSNLAPNLVKSPTVGCASPLDREQQRRKAKKVIFKKSENKEPVKCELDKLKDESWGQLY